MMQRNTELLVSTRRTIVHYHRIVKEIGSHYGLIQIEADIIGFLENNPGKDTASDIVDLRGFSKGNVSNGVEHLVQKGFVVRVNDEIDHRIIHLKLTEQAAPLIKQIKEATRHYYEELFDGFSEDEIRLYTKMTDRILKNSERIEERGDGLE
ncbi:MAG: MarR family transcriptional regulator [Solobacterium sp.]|jgi:MarR family transcriptional regulator for hemolysin|nr:MarR family transcriptional regulator [Solobacterium sp.]MCH4223157.1 MarR family transcriptional regulator [Solobacterium sp.]